MLRRDGLLAVLTSLAAALGCAGDDSPSVPSITILAPTGGERWAVGSVQRVEWQASGIQDLYLEISWDGGEAWGSLPPSLSMSSLWTPRGGRSAWVRWRRWM